MTQRFRNYSGPGMETFCVVYYIEPVMCVLVFVVIGNLSIPEIVGIVVAGVSVTAIVSVILVISK